MKRPSTLSVLAGILCLPPCVVLAGTFTHQEPRAGAARAPSTLGIQPGRVEFDAVGWPSALKIHGKGAGLDGQLQVEDASVSGVIGFDLKALETGIALRDRHLKETYLETARFPRATLTLSRVSIAHVPATDRFPAVTVPFEGKLSLHGVEKAVGGEAKVMRAGSSVSTTASFSIDIRDFGIQVPSYMGITVAEKVQVRVGFPAVLETARDALPH